jgi:hypothetical protein
MIYGVEVDLDKSKCFSLSHSLARTVDEANGTQANDDSATFSLFRSPDFDRSFPIKFQLFKRAFDSMI